MATGGPSSRWPEIAAQLRYPGAVVDWEVSPLPGESFRPPTPVLDPLPSPKPSPAFASPFGSQRNPGLRRTSRKWPLTPDRSQEVLEAEHTIDKRVIDP